MNLTAAGLALRTALVDYLGAVVDTEWAEMDRRPKERDRQARGWRDIETMIATLAEFEPQGPSGQLFMAQALTQVSALQDARQTRMLQWITPIHSAIGWILLVGGISTVALPWYSGWTASGATWSSPGPSPSRSPWWCC